MVDTKKSAIMPDDSKRIVLVQLLLNFMSTFKDDCSFLHEAKFICPKLDEFCTTTLEDLRAICTSHEIPFESTDFKVELIERLGNAGVIISNKCDRFLDSTPLAYKQAKERCNRVGKGLDETMANSPFNIPESKTERKKIVELDLTLKIGAEGMAEGMHIGAEGMQALSLFIATGTLTNLIKLYLGWNQIGDEGMKALSGAIASGAFLNLEILNLAHNTIGDAGLTAFAEVLKSPRRALPKLELLRLNSNVIGDAGLVALFGGFRAGSRAQGRGRRLRYGNFAHHFGPFPPRFSAPRAVCYAPLGAHADQVPIGAYHPML